MHACELRKIIDQKIFDDYFKFCVEREPVDKCISYYFMRKNSPNSSYKRKNMTWDEFVNKKRFPVDMNFYSFENNLIVDKIIKYENLDKELKSLLSNLGINNFGENYAQELEEKANNIDENVCWHFIGPLQSNKAKIISKYADWIHTIDRKK